MTLESTGSAPPVYSQRDEITQKQPTRPPVLHSQEQMERSSISSRMHIYHTPFLIQFHDRFTALYSSLLHFLFPLLQNCWDWLKRCFSRKPPRSSTNPIQVQPSSDRRREEDLISEIPYQSLPNSNISLLCDQWIGTRSLGRPDEHRLENPLEGTPEDVKLDRPEDPLKKLHKQYSLDDASISLGYSSDNEESLRSPLPQIQLPAKAEQEMKSLAEQAMVQHKNKTPLSTEHSIYPPTEITELLFASTGKSQKRQEKIPPYSSAIQHYIGKEQNAAFHAVYDSIEVIGIFDGHGPIIEINVGASVAQLASKICKSQFCKLLRGQGGNIALTLDLLCTKIHKSIIRKPSLRMGGTTAAIACRDLKTGNIYTATVGTAEVTLYVEIEEKVYPWPLSYMQRWEENIGTLRQYYRREKTRGLFVTLDKKLRATRTALELAEMDPDLPDRLPTLPFALGVYNSAGQWTRLAGSLGDVTFPLLEHRPRITQVSTSIPGLEILAMVATSDPFKFFLSELEITSAITDWHASCTPTAERLAENLIDLWNKRKPSEDDVTIVALCQKSSIGDSI